MKKIACVTVPLALAASFCAPAAASAATLNPADLAPQPRAAAVLASASEASLLETYSGTCGDNLTWTLDTTTGVLTISGTGDMADWSSSGASPWHQYCSSVKSVSLPSGLTSIGHCAFDDCRSLTSIDIPEGVTSIGWAAFRYTSLASATIPESVTSIGRGAFNTCTSLASFSVTTGNTTYSSPDGRCLVENGTKLIAYANASGPSYSIPSSITSIDHQAFYGCESLAEISIPEGVTSIGSYAFRFCSSLASLSVPKSLASIDYDAFEGCTSLASFSVTTGNTTYSSPDGRCLVENGTKLIYYANASGSSYSIPSSITSIGNSAFAWCGLTSITIPEGVTSVGSCAFYACHSLTSLVLPEGVTSISELAFSSCRSLEVVSLPSSVSSIDHDAFMNLPSGSEIFCATQGVADLFVDGTNYQSANTTVLVSTYSGTCGAAAYWSLNADTGALTIYGTGEMYGYTMSTHAPWYDYRASIKSVTVQSGVTSIGSCAFSEHASLESASIPSTITSLGDYAFNGCTSLGSVSIPEGVTTIGHYTFQNCTSLGSISIPSTTTSIGYGIFRGCTSLTEFSVAGGNTSCSSPDGRCLMKGTELRAYAYASGSSYSVPSKATSIGDYTFDHCASLTSVTIPEGVTSIGNEAFCGCTSLDSVSLPSTLSSIGGYAFHGCTSLESVTIPSNVASICSDSFTGLSSGSVITCDTQAVADLFVDGDNYNSSNTTIKVKSIKSGTCGDNMTWTYDPSDGSLTINPEGAMYDYGEGNPAPWADLPVTSVCMLEGVKTVGENAFSDNPEVTEVVIEEPLMESVGAGAFIGIAEDATVTVPTLDDGELLVQGVNIMSGWGAEQKEFIGDHTGDWAEVKAATCTETGEESQVVLLNAGGSYTATRPTDSLGHAPNWVLSTQPAAGATGVAVTACTRAGCDYTDRKAVSLFPDVTSAGVWYYGSAYLARAVGFVSGFDDGSFGADATLTRAMAATMLWHHYRPEESAAYDDAMAGTANETGMADVASSAWYTGAANWAVKAGVFSGKDQPDGSKLFDPYGPITREQLCAVMANAAATHNRDGDAEGANRTKMESMPDASSVSDWAKGSVAWSLNHGVISGKVYGGAAHIDPLGNVTRSEVAAMLMNTLNADLMGKAELEL